MVEFGTRARIAKSSIVRRAHSGFTLIELLIVMGLLATVFGIGLGAFAALDVEQRQAAGVIKEALRTARNAALAHQAPARVRIDSEAGSLVPVHLQVIGTWSFEQGLVPGQVQGAFGIDGLAEGGAWTKDGWIGDALEVAQDGRVEIPIKDNPDWDLRDGFTIRVVVRRDDTGGGHLLRIGRTLGIDVGAKGDLRAWFVPTLEAEGAKARSGGRVVLESDPGVVPPGRWVRLSFSYDRRQLELAADGIPRSRKPENRSVWKLDGPLLLSDEQRPFPGAIDSLVVSAMVVDPAQVLPQSVRITNAPEEVRFAADGTLERAVHDGPIELQLQFEDGLKEAIVIGVYGTIE